MLKFVYALVIWRIIPVLCLADKFSVTSKATNGDSLSPKDQ